MSSTAPDVSWLVSLLRKLRRLSRFLAFLCTAGWAFPHVCTEDMDLTKIQNDHMAKKS